MNRTEITALIAKEGLSYQEIVTEWADHGLIDLKELENSLRELRQQREYVAAKGDVAAGMYLHKNGKIGRMFNYKECTAVILNVDRQKDELLMMSLNGKTLPFSSQGYCFDTQWLSCGLNATHMMSQMADDAGAEVEAVRFCLGYSDAFVREGAAFLMTEEEVLKLRPNSMQIMTALNAAQVPTSGFWLSTAIEKSLKADEAENNVALYFTLQQDGITIGKECTTTPKAVYPVFSLHFSSLNGIKN